MSSDIAKETAQSKRPHSDSESDDEDETLDSAFQQPDLTLIVGKRKRKLHVTTDGFKKISVVFENMVSSDFKEKKTKEIHFEGKNYKTFVRFIRVAHPGIQTVFDEETVYQVLPLIDEYLAEDARRRADKFLFDVKGPKVKLLSSTQLVDELSTADKYKLEKYLDVLTQEASCRRISKLESNHSFSGVSYKTKCKIFEMKARLTEQKYLETHINSPYFFKDEKTQEDVKFSEWFESGCLSDL